MFTFESHVTSRVEIKNLILNFFFLLFVLSVPIQTQKSKDTLTSPHTNSQDNIGFDLAKCAAQLLYGPVLVYFIFGLLRSLVFLLLIFTMPLNQANILFKLPT